MSAVAVTGPLAIRDAALADVSEVTDLERRSFPVPWKWEYFASEVGQPFRFNRVARDARGALVGYVFCAWAGGEIHVNKIAVEDRVRRSGVAHRLMAEVFALGNRVGTEEIYLEVRPSNAPARRFYEKLGFAVTGRRKAYYLDGEDALVMVLPRPEAGFGES